MKILSNLNSERAFLSGLINYGAEGYYDILDIGINEGDFVDDSHRSIFKCCEHLFENNAVKVDVPSIYSAANSLGLHHYFKQQQEIEYLKSIIDYEVDQSNLRGFAQQIKKLSAARNIYKSLDEVRSEIAELDGTESVNEIFSILENKLFNLANFVIQDDILPTKMGDGLKEYIDDLINNQQEQAGISSGFPIFDSLIGGGLRGGSVNIFAARPGTGKSSLASQIAYNVTKLGIPTLYLFNEMRKKDFLPRLLANLSDIPSFFIETGRFAQSQRDLIKIEEARQEIEKLPFYEKNIAGMDFDSQLAVMKRWILRDVGLNNNGTASTCLIIYDQLKLTDMSDNNRNMQETQILGNLITRLDIMANKYDIPLVCLCQTNRDGIDRETTGAISQSDRFSWIASTLSLLKKKSDEEMALDPVENGNTKLIILKSRFGPGTEYGNYINLHMKGSCSRIVEGRTKFELLSEKKKFIPRSQVDTSVEIPAEEKIEF